MHVLMKDGDLLRQFECVVTPSCTTQQHRDPALKQNVERRVAPGITLHSIHRKRNGVPPPPMRKKKVRLTSGCGCASMSSRSAKWLSSNGGLMRMLSFVTSLCSPKRRFGKDEQKMKCGFSIEFSTICSPNRVLNTLKSASFEIRISSFVHPSQIFVW